MPRPTTPPGVDPNLEFVPLDKIEKTGLAGVGFIDRGETSLSLSRLATAVAVDAAVLLAFAAIGRASHSESLLDVELLNTALPFILGWWGAAPFLGGYSQKALSSDLGLAARAALQSWAVAAPLGLVLRGVSKGYVPPMPFVIISLVVTCGMMVGWRALFSLTATKVGSKATRGNKRGGVFEFFDLLTSLVKRW